MREKQQKKKRKERAGKKLTKAKGSQHYIDCTLLALSTAHRTDNSIYTQQQKKEEKPRKYSFQQAPNCTT